MAGRRDEVRETNVAGGIGERSGGKSGTGMASTGTVRRENEREGESWLGVTASISWARGRYCTEREWRPVKRRSRGVEGKWDDREISRLRRGWARRGAVAKERNVEGGRCAGIRCGQEGSRRWR